MAKAQKKSMFSQLIEKRTLDQRRFTTLDGSRWKFGYQVFRAFIGKIVILNLLVLACSALLIFTIFNLMTRLNIEFSSAPFFANLGIGYMPFTWLSGLQSDIVLSAIVSFVKVLPLSGALLGVGLAGGLYVMRNMLWLEEVSVVKDFFKGIAKNFNVILLTVVFSIILGLCILCIAYADYFTAMGTVTGLHKFARVISIIAIILFSLIFLHAIVMTVTYKVSFMGLIKNSFLVSFMFLLIPIHLFIIAIACIPFILIMLGGVFAMVAIALCLVFGFSYVLLVWTNYCHWIYERFLSSSIETPKGETPEKTVAKTQDKPKAEVKVETLPVKPLSEDDKQVRNLPSVYTINDIIAVNDSIESMKRDSDEYYENHKNNK